MVKNSLFLFVFLFSFPTLAMLPKDKIAPSKSLLDFPQFEKSAAEVESNVQTALDKANEALNIIANRKDEEITFTNTIVALDDIFYDVDTVIYRIGLLGSTSADKDLRKKADESDIKVEQWMVDVKSRADIFRVLQVCEKKYPTLKGEDRQLQERFLRDYRRMGFHLPPEQQEQTKIIRKRLATLETEISTNIKKANNDTIYLTEAEVAGVPAETLKGLTRDSDNRYIIRVGVQSETDLIMKNAPQESVRKKVLTANASRAKEINTPLMKEVIQQKTKLANLLGYKNWADYRTEVLMSQSGDRAYNFINDLSKQLEPKFKKEIETLRLIKVKETGNPDATIESWDIRYYEQKYLAEAFSIDLEGLKKFFKLEFVLKGMFKTYETIFNIKIESVTAPYVWDKEVTAIKISDATTKEDLGYLYLDLFPRPENEKYGHFAMFSIRSGKRLSDGTYHRPVSALICNFPRANADGTPSLLSLQHVETIFHEFGHGLHALLTKSNYSTFSGSKVARDFVEAPSQLLENWPLDKAVLDTFARNYKNEKEKIPSAILANIQKSKIATAGINYRRQFAFGLLDLKLHREITAEQDFDITALTNQVLKEVFVPFPEGTSFISSFGHVFGGYDSAYYGYAWADCLASDMASIFEASPKKFLDKKIGMRLRKEIYEVGGSRDENISVKAFLKREPSNLSFLKQLGLK